MSGCGLQVLWCNLDANTNSRNHFSADFPVSATSVEQSALFPCQPVGTAFHAHIFVPLWMGFPFPPLWATAAKPPSETACCQWDLASSPMLGTHKWWMEWSCHWFTTYKGTLPSNGSHLNCMFSTLWQIWSLVLWRCTQVFGGSTFCGLWCCGYTCVWIDNCSPNAWLNQGYTPLVQVTRVLMGSITEPTASDVAEAATLVSTTQSLFWCNII